MVLIRRYRVGRWLLFARLALQLLPELAHQRMQCGIIEPVESAAGEHDGIDTANTGQCMLLRAKTFANDAFDTIALMGEPDVFLGDDKTEPGPLEQIGPGKNQQFLTGDAQICGVEYLLEVGGRQQTQSFGKTKFAHGAATAGAD